MPDPVGSAAEIYVVDRGTKGTAHHDALSRLTSGEIACLDGVHAGLGSKEIARRLNISPHTVDARLRSACRKLSTNSRFVAATWLAEAHRSATEAPDDNLIYQDLSLHTRRDGVEQEAPIGEGIEPIGLVAQVSTANPTLDGLGSQSLKGQLRYSIAIIFGGQNNLSILKRLAWIGGIAALASIAFGLLLNGLVGVSRVILSP